MRTTTKKNIECGVIDDIFNSEKVLFMKTLVSINESWMLHLIQLLQ